KSYKISQGSENKGSILYSKLHQFLDLKMQNAGKMTKIITNKSCILKAKVLLCELFAFINSIYTQFSTSTIFLLVFVRFRISLRYPNIINTEGSNAPSSSIPSACNSAVKLV